MDWRESLPWPQAPEDQFLDEAGRRWTVVRGVHFHRISIWLGAVLGLLAAGMAIRDRNWIYLGVLLVCAMVLPWRWRSTSKHEVRGWRVEQHALLLRMMDGSTRDLGPIQDPAPFGPEGLGRFQSVTHWTYRFPQTELKKDGQVIGIVGLLLSPLLSPGLASVSAELLMADYQARFLLLGSYLRRRDTCHLVRAREGLYLLTARSVEALRAGLVGL